MLSTPHINLAVSRKDTLGNKHTQHSDLVPNTILPIKGPRLFGEITDSRAGAGNIQVTHSPNLAFMCLISMLPIIRELSS